MSNRLKPNIKGDHNLIIKLISKTNFQFRISHKPWFIQHFEPKYSQKLLNPPIQKRSLFLSEWKLNFRRLRAAVEERG